MNDKIFLLLLAVFASVVGGLVWGLNPKPPEYPSIGGGGYDLTRPVFTLLLLAFTGLWTLIMLLISWNISNPTASQRLLLLAVIGAFSTVVSIGVYYDNLF